MKRPLMKDLVQGYYTFRLRNGQSGRDGVESGTAAALLLTAELFSDKMYGKVGKMDTAGRFRPSGSAKEETFMDNNMKETNRPLDQEELSQTQSAKVAGGLQINTANYNTANINTANFNTANVNIANFNIANIDIPPKT